MSYATYPSHSWGKYPQMNSINYYGAQPVIAESLKIKLERSIYGH